jgi:hypothetical protein
VGAAALLRRHAPWASAVQIRNALIESANAAAIGDGSAAVDRGQGLLDVPAAAALLDNAAISETLAEGLGEERVAANVKSTGLSPIVFTAGTFSQRVQGLLPGQVAHFFVPTDPDTQEIRIHVTDIVSEAPGEQNQVFGDDVLVHVVDAPTSLARTHVEAFIDANNTFVVSRPQPGLMRVAIGGAFSNGGPVSATVTVERQRTEESGKATLNGDIRHGKVIASRLDVPAGTQKLTVDLSWRSDWGRYPTADLDLTIVNPIGESTSIATLDSPERVSIEAPMPGQWTVSVNGFVVPDVNGESFDLRVFADGRLLRPRR